MQTAYEVLADPKEREWYDLHRDEILSGRKFKQRASSAANEDWLDVHDLYRYFSASAYHGFKGNGSFYDVYGRLFRRLQQEEREAFYEKHERERDENEQQHPLLRKKLKGGRNKTNWREENEFEEILDFGNQDSEYPAELYARFSSFSTSKEFRAAESMEELFAKMFFGIALPSSSRHQAKVEFNETVRKLADFVKKRDPRWIAMVQAKEAEKKRKEEERAERLKKEKAERLAKAKAFQPQAWA